MTHPDSSSGRPDPAGTILPPAYLLAGGGVLVALLLGGVILIRATAGRTAPVANRTEETVDLPQAAEPAEMNPEMNPEENPPEETPTPVIPAPTKPAAAVPASAEPAVAPPPAAPKKPTPPAPPAPKAVSAKPAPAPPLKPFAGFASSIALPERTQTAAVTLGPVKVPEDFICTLNLLGGEKAGRTRHIFVCEAADGGKAERAWDVVAREPGTETSGTKLGQFSLRAGSLKFAWLPDAAEHPATPYFHNCAARVAAGPGTHTFALRHPQRGSALPVSYEKSTVSWPIPDPPKFDRVQVEFDMNAPKSLPRARFLGSAMIPAGGETWIEFGLKPADKFLKIQIQTTLDSKGLNVTLTPWVQVSGQPKPVVLSEPNLKKLAESILQTERALERQIAGLPKSKKGANPQRDAVEKQLTITRQAREQLSKLKSLEDSFAQQARLSVRAYYPANEAVVELLVAK